MLKTLFKLIIVIILYEFSIITINYFESKRKYKQSIRSSNRINKPLVVLGSPYSNISSKFYGKIIGYGDYCVDNKKCKGNLLGENIDGNINENLEKFGKKSCVVYISNISKVKDKLEKINEIACSNGIYYSEYQNYSILNKLLNH